MEFTTDNKLITFDDCNSSKSSFMFDISKSTIPASKFIGIYMPGLEIPPKQGEVDYYLSPIIGRKIKNQRFSQLKKGEIWLGIAPRFEYPTT